MYIPSYPVPSHPIPFFATGCAANAGPRMLNQVYGENVGSLSLTRYMYVCKIATPHKVYGLDGRGLLRLRRSGPLNTVCVNGTSVAVNDEAGVDERRKTKKTDRH